MGWKCGRKRTGIAVENILKNFRSSETFFCGECLTMRADEHRYHAARKVRSDERACRHVGNREPAAASKARPIYPPLFRWTAQRRSGQTPTRTAAARFTHRHHAASSRA